jgi:hypothetical protein
MKTDSRSSGMNVGPRKLLTIPTMNPSMNNCFYLKCWQTSPLSMNVGLGKLLMIPIMNPSTNNCFYSKCWTTSPLSMDIGLRKLTIPTMNPSTNSIYYCKSVLLTFVPSAATTRTDSRSSGMNVGPKKLLMIPTMNQSMNNHFYSKSVGRLPRLLPQ